MTTLNARANQAYHDAVEKQGVSGFDHQRDAFEEGWETGYKTRDEEVARDVALIKAEALDEAAARIIIPGASSSAAAWLQGAASKLRSEVSS